MSDYGVEDHACRTMCLIRGGLSRKFKKLNYGKKKSKISFKCAILLDIPQREMFRTLLVTV